MNNHSPATYYERIGGEPAIRQLVACFYQRMDTLPEVATIRRMHSESLQRAEQKLFMFLSGWMGGPPLYVELFGHPRLRQRHLPFAIGEQERDQWMHCMQEALQETVADEALRHELNSAFHQIADFMRNQA